MRNLMVFAMGSVLLVLSSGCALGQREQSYMESNGTSLTFLRWEEEGDERISGEIRSVYASESFEPIEGGSAFTGAANGDRITIDASSADLTSQWIGEVEDGRLVVIAGISGDEERIFEAASEEEFEEAAEDLKAELASKAEQLRREEEAAEREQAEQGRREAEAASRQQDLQEAEVTLTQALEDVEILSATLEDATYQLEEEFEVHVDSIEDVRTGHGEAQEAAANGECLDRASLAEGAFREDVDQFYGSRENVDDARDTVEDARADLEQAVEDTQTYLEDLQGTAQANESGDPVPENEAEDVETSVARAEERILEANTALEQVQEQTPALEQEVSELEPEAIDLYNRVDVNESDCGEEAASAPASTAPEGVSALEGSSASDGSSEQRFISEYYEAVGEEDWETTYSLLDSESQARFSEDEWVSKQQARDAASGAAPIQSATIDGLSEEGGGFTASITLAYEDGTQSALDGIEVVSEGGEYKRHLTTEEISILNDY